MNQVVYVAGCITALAVFGCGLSPKAAAPQAAMTVADTLSRATTPDGAYISWAEHLIDAEDVNGGVAIRGGDGLALADLDRDGHLDVVTAQEDSNHLRVAFGTSDPDRWSLHTIASGRVVGAIEDVVVADLSGDGWPDIVAACEDAHLAYFENPGDAATARREVWATLIPPSTEGRGAWLRVFAADLTGDGRLDLTAANKGAADIVRPEAGDPSEGPTSLFTLSGPPLDPDSWNEQVLFREGIPNTALPVDVDGDGDIDVLAAARKKNKLTLLLNEGLSADGGVIVRAQPIALTPAFPAPDDWRGLTNAFQADFADLDRDGRLDLVVNVQEVSREYEGPRAGLGWLQQPASLSAPWRYHRIGTTLPDWVIGIHLADLDGDGDLDAITGGYSGLNVLAGSYSAASREKDDGFVTAASTVGRIAWFQNPGDATMTWTRHDISRRVRGMYDMFATRDLDGDGDLDIIAPRGNSGSFDGAFWLEQVHSRVPQKAFTPARAVESRALPLPPSDWQSIYDRRETYIAPNKVK